MSTHMFPEEYYKICSSNRRRIHRNWFCNRPPTPTPIQVGNVTSSDDSLTDTVEANNLEEALNSVNGYSLENDEVESSCSMYDNSDQDPDFIPDTSDSEEETELQDDVINNLTKENCGDIETNNVQEALNTVNGCSLVNDQVELNCSTHGNSDEDPDFIPDTSDSNKENCEQVIFEVNSLSEESLQAGKTQILGVYKPNGDIRKGNKKKDFCLFCESYVLNFARHITRNHSLETDVGKILSLSPKNKLRNKLLCDLRKKGNYLNNSFVQKPIRQSQIGTKILPCSNCLGFFSLKQLWRHRKACMGKSDKSHQTSAQNLLLKNLRIDKQLREIVFPRMRADDISLKAKKDELICAYGCRYFKSHREKHFINVTSRKMRELARLLIEVQKLEPSINDLFNALKPQHFGILVSATKIVSQYNEDNEYFESASTALNLGTAIKQCCQIAIVFVLKRKNVHSTISAAEAEADLKTLIQLIDSEWRFEISTQAASDLNMKKWNKITMVPLASDLRKIKEYLISTANTAVSRLETNSEDKEAYTILLETVFCRVLLLNRRRPGELQRLPLHLYEQGEEHPKNYEEFSELITPSEKILIQRFKRIVIRGKRGRGVPVLFSSDIQEHIRILLRHRAHFVCKNNGYLFGNPNTIQPVCGYKIIAKYAKLSGTKNPQAITATKLRKHLATLTQVLNMSDNDIEQLSTFMGHTVNIHRGSYRLPNDLYQTAKISKLLLLMEKGQAAQHKGKSLDEINIDLDIDLNDNDSDEDEIDPFAEDSDLLQETNQISLNTEYPSTSLTKKQNVPVKILKRTLVPWTGEQKNVTRKFFASHIKKKVPPKKNECLMLKEKYPKVFENKDWSKIKVFVQNEYVKKN